MTRILCLTLLVFSLAACGSDTTDTPPVTDTPVASPTDTATVTSTPLPSATSTDTPTASPTATASPTFTPPGTPTLAARVLAVTAVMPGVTLEPNDEPGDTVGSPPLDEWVRLEADHPSLEYIAGDWIPMWSWSASQNEYRYSVEADAAVRLRFEGEGLRVCYVSFWNGGIWEILVDGQLLRRVDSYSPEAHFTCTDTLPAAPGEHVLLVRNTGERHADSTDSMLALDAVLTYASRSSTVPTLAVSLTPSPAPRPARHIELIQGPPVIQPTSTAAPPAVVTAAVLIAYDENANRSVEPAEGVRGIPVRLVDITTNRVLAQAFTDESGFARVQVQTNAQLRLVVPYFGQYWDISRRGTRENSAFTLLLPAGNQPGLIP